jgi:hypothetical protein
MTAFIGFFGAILGALAGAISTYLTARSNMRLACFQVPVSVLASDGRRAETRRFTAVHAELP